MARHVPMCMPAGTDRFTSTISAAGPHRTMQGNGRECLPIRVSNSSGSRDRSANPARMNFNSVAKGREFQEPQLPVGEHPLLPDRLVLSGEVGAVEESYANVVCRPSGSVELSINPVPVGSY
jgi:hypothetical protein